MARATISDLKEMQKFARQWRKGNEAFKDLFDSLPKAPDAVYNEFVLKDEPEMLHLVALDACNEAWAEDESRRQTKTLRKDTNVKIRTIRASDAPRAKQRRDTRALRRDLNAEVRSVRSDIIDRGGMLASIDDADKPSKAYNAKAFMILCLGKFIEEQGTAAIEELQNILEESAA
jgi:hypothetical protein